MGRLIVIEGLDGSGKNTLAARLQRQVTAEGGRLHRIDFPRYQVSIYADLVREMLYGRLGDVSESVYGGALLFALDRRDAARDIRNALRDNDFVLLDRYVSSNAAYGAARLGGPAVPGAADEFPEWVRQLEIERFELPVPDRQLLLGTPVALAQQRARQRAAGNAERQLDRFESDQQLQQRTAAMYAELAARHYLSPWTVLETGADTGPDPETGTGELMRLLAD